MQAAERTEAPPQLERYALRRRIAVGGMAEVFEACDSQRDERVVVKLLLPHLCGDAEVLQMFADEARLTTQLTHDNLVRTHDTGQLQGRPYLVMELVDGCTLEALLKRSGALSPELAGRITLDVLQALRYLHGHCDEAGQCLHVVHRDVNPRNVLLSRDGAVKLADFGIARSRMRAARTRSGVIKGTVQYMSPEQITGSDLDHRADLYGVGLVLFEMLTGRPYIEGAQEIDLLRLAENPVWRPPSKVNPDLPETIDRLLQPALMRFPEQRYRDADAFESALEQALDALDARAASAEQLGQLVASLPARAGTVPPLVVDPHKPTGEQPSAAPAPGLAEAARATGGTRRRVIWLAAAVAATMALAGGLLWQWSGQPAVPAARVQAPRAVTPSLQPPPRPAAERSRERAIAVAPARSAATRPGGGTADTAAVVLATAASTSPATSEDRARTTRPRPRAEPSPATRRPRRRVASARATRKTSTASATRPRAAGPASTAAAAASSADAQRDASIAQLRQRLTTALQRLRNRGVRPTDLPGNVRQGIQTTTQALADKNPSRATAALTQLERQLPTVVVDRAFVQRKLSSVDRALRRLPPERRDLQQLRQRSAQALQAFMDGNFNQSNRQLNRILTLLQRTP